jgi:hypothetical protein
MNKELIENILHQITIDESFFGEGFINSWVDFASFRRAYEDTTWSEEETETLNLLFLLMRRGICVQNLLEWA